MSGTDGQNRSRQGPGRPGLLLVLLVVQVVCAAAFLLDIILSLTGLPPLSWTLHELIELAATAGLMLGIVTGWVALHRARARTAAAESRLRVATGAFMDLLEERFADWGLTPAERDVALFSIKGLSTADIARLRDTSEGTVKAQTAAIYRKAGVSGRPQLLSLFIDELMAGPVVPDEPAPPPQPPSPPAVRPGPPPAPEAR